MDKKQSMQVKLQKISTKIQKNKYVSSISKGLSSMMAIILTGSIFTLISTFNYEPYQNFLESTGLATYVRVPATITIDLIALYVVFSVAFALAGEFKKDGLSSGAVALLSFLAVTPTGLLDDGETMALSYQWLGSAGMFVAIIVGIFSARLYALIIDKELYIKMPKEVPPSITKAFASLTPAFASVIIMLIIRSIFEMTRFGNIHEFIYSSLQAPLTGLGGQWWAFMILLIPISVLWFFGIHGALVVASVMSPIWNTLRFENLEAYQAGQELPNLIVGVPFLRVYALVGGSGAMIGLGILLLFAKSKRYKTLGKLAIIPVITGINEPLIFGLPVVLNVKLLIPLIVAPLTTSGLGILATAMGILPKIRGIGVPSGTPIGLLGLIEGGWRVGVFQLFLAVVSTVIWYPFFKMIDNEALAVERGEVDPETVV